MSANRLKTGPKGKGGPGNQSRMLWIGVAAAVVLFIVVAVMVAGGERVPFRMTGGDDNPIAFLRNETTVYYDFIYTGDASAVLERVIPRIQLYQEQVLVADVQQVSVRYGDTEVVLEKGALPAGQFVTLQPDDTFQIGVTYLGQEIGWNRIYGFRLQYSQEGRAFDVELELKDDYYIFVE